MAILTTGNSYSDGNQITSSNLNAVVNSATFSDPVDTSSGLNLTADSPPKIAINTSLSNKILTGGSLNNCPIGAVTASTGSFTTLSASGDISVDGTVKQSGNEGNLIIQGGDTAGANIELYGSNHATVSIRNNAYYDAGVHVFRPVDGSSSSVVITSDGEVGIGDDTPSYKLDVNGTGRFTSTVQFDGQTQNYNGAYDIYRSGAGYLRHRIADQTLSLGVTNTAGTVHYPIVMAAASDVLIFNNEEGEMARFDTSGNLGIGAESPSEKLHVKSSNSDTAETVAGFGNGDIDVGLEIKTNGNGGSSLDWGFNAVNSRHLVFDTNQTERMRIRSDGNVGINTDPSCKLDVNSGATNQVALFESTDATAYIELADDTGSAQLLTPSSGDFRIYTGGAAGGGLSGTSKLTVKANGDVGIGDDTPSYKLDVNGTGRFVNDLTLDEDLVHNLTGSGSLPGYDADVTGGTFGAVLEDGGANGSTLYMARKNSWALYLATDTNINPQSHTGKKKVVQFADLYDQTSTQGNAVGNIAINTSSTAFNTSSDYRLKENEVDITDGINRLKELKPYRFNFIRNPSEVVDGFFAHEVSPVVPESITGSKDAVDEEGKPDYQGIDQSKLVPLLTAALQEAVAKIEALEARVQTLEG